MQKEIAMRKTMRKKILVAAVASALAAPAAALAQSSVTINGYIQLSADNMKASNAPARTKTSERRVNDDSSSVVFNVTEDLGDGTAAIVRVDLKPNLDTGALAASGESWVGLRSRTWGQLTMGRHSLHYFLAPDDAYYKGASYRIHPSSLTDFAGGGRIAIANATRTPNSIKWTSPNWSGFGLVAAYSTNPLASAGVEADMTAGNTARDGRAWNLHPTYTAANWKIGYSFWDGKADNPSAIYSSALSGLSTAPLGTSTTVASLAGQLITADQRSNTLYGYYTWDGWKLGGLWTKAELTAAATGAGLAPIGTRLGNRAAWSIPLRYTTGAQSFMATYTRAQDDKATVVRDGAKMWSLTYGYALSKRTNLALSLNQIRNDAGAAYTHYVDAGAGTNNALAAGERARLVTVGMRHEF
jgi:predicted porin